MQRLLSIILSLCLLGQCSQQLGMQALYRINQDFITKYHCVNTNRPELRCEGRCYLKQKLADAAGKAQHQEKGQHHPAFEFFVYLLPIPMAPVMHPVSGYPKIIYGREPAGHLPEIQHKPVFQPPRLV